MNYTVSAAFLTVHYSVIASTISIQVQVIVAGTNGLVLCVIEATSLQHDRLDIAA